MEIDGATKSSPISSFHPQCYAHSPIKIERWRRCVFILPILMFDFNYLFSLTLWLKIFLVLFHSSLDLRDCSGDWAVWIKGRSQFCSWRGLLVRVDCGSRQNAFIPLLTIFNANCLGIRLQGNIYLVVIKGRKKMKRWTSWIPKWIKFQMLCFWNTTYFLVYTSPLIADLPHKCTDRRERRFGGRVTGSPVSPSSWSSWDLGQKILYGNTIVEYNYFVQCFCMHLAHVI